MKRGRNTVHDLNVPTLFNTCSIEDRISNVSYHSMFISIKNSFFQFICFSFFTYFIVSHFTNFLFPQIILLNRPFRRDANTINLSLKYYYFSFGSFTFSLLPLPWQPFFRCRDFWIPHKLLFFFTVSPTSDNRFTSLSFLSRSQPHTSRRPVRFLRLIMKKTLTFGNVSSLSSVHTKFF